jgi:hypothetical protein
MKKQYIKPDKWNQDIIIVCHKLSNFQL